MATVPVALSRPIARRPSRRTWALGLLGVAAVAFVVLRGQFLLPNDDSSPVFQTLNDARGWIDSNRQGNPALAFMLANIRGPIAQLAVTFQGVLAAIGWTGVTAIMGALGYIFGGWRLAALMVGGFLMFGVLGLWEAASTRSPRHWRRSSSRSSSAFRWHHRRPQRPFQAPISPTST
jgi:glycine betaine/proline transport system permease protein